MQAVDAVTARPSAVVRPLASGPNLRGTLTLREVIDGYMAAYTGLDHSRTHRLAFWSEALGELRIGELDSDHVADALELLAQQPAQRWVAKRGEPRAKSPSTLNRYRQALAAVLTWARHRRLTPKGWQHPVRELQGYTEGVARTRFLSADERERLLKVCRLSAWPKLHLLVLLAITTGARRGELLALRYRDLDLERATAHVRTSKNGEQRVLPLTDAVIAEIRRHGLGSDEALLFASRWRPSQPHSVHAVWDSALRTARIDNFKFHDLRHSCASYLAQSGASLLEIADVLGHKSLRMTQRYSHLTIDTKRRLVHRVLGDIGAANKAA